MKIHLTSTEAQLIVDLLIAESVRAHKNKENKKSEEASQLSDKILRASREK